VCTEADGVDSDVMPVPPLCPLLALLLLLLLLLLRRRFALRPGVFRWRVGALARLLNA
jgi:MYXO-CTERM domain-containing protein